MKLTKRSKVSQLSIIAFFLSLFASFQAAAITYIPAEVGTAFTDIKADFEALMSVSVWPLIISIMAAFFIVKIVKRAAGAA